DRRDELVDRVRERVAAIGREAERARARRLAEVVDVAPVARGRTSSGDAVELGAELGRAAGAGRAGDEDVEVLGLDAEAEVHRSDGAVLAHGALERLELGGRLEAELADVALAAQPLRRYAQRAGGVGGHAYLTRILAEVGVGLDTPCSTGSQRSGV